MTLTVSNRDLLRNYRQLKDKLISGELDEVIVTQKGGMTMKICLVHVVTPMEKLLKMVKEKPLKGIKRPKWDII